jgi:hypothetical protein
MYQLKGKSVIWPPFGSRLDNLFSMREHAHPFYTYGDAILEHNTDEKGVKTYGCFCFSLAVDSPLNRAHHR